MTIFRAKTDDLNLLLQVQSASMTAFWMKAPNGDLEAALRSYKENPKGPPDLQIENHWVAVDDDGALMSTMQGIDYTVRFDGHEVGMCGIGGVATFPQYRHRGGVREIFSKLLPAMYEKGQLLSFLYPFSPAYYRKFGYEQAARYIEYRIEMKNLLGRRYQGSFTFCDEKSDLAPFRQVYDAFAQGMNASTVRGEAEWRGFLPNPFDKGVFTYLYRDEQGTPKGYVKFERTENHDKAVIKCLEFVFAEFSVAAELLAFFAQSFMANADLVKVLLPEHIRLDAIINEHTEQLLGFGEMARVVNVREVLSKAAYRGTGEVCLKLTDAQIPQNAGCWRVRYADGRAQSVEQCADCACDAAMDIGLFSRFILGAHCVCELAYFAKIELNCAPEKLSGIFYKKPVGLFDPF